MTKSESQKSWVERLMIACSYEADSIQEEHDYFRNQANSAPLKELELFLSMPPGKFDRPARVVMGQVYKERLKQQRKEEVSKESRAQWWSGLAQQVTAQILGALIIGLILGFITGVWFIK
ncbi:hypothetical protein CW740_06675 [Kangiella profundi]|uniref:Uncharacterized protein n=1 Tax=Kangiella profundi TaxID=1561924 RepID=A0A2K9AYL0_9GAMM|nr:hypothetical protein [Kangiella profundi]AUD78949.1 hypothetical protein CW740_06675 [Kangiella profundi]GGF02751.1 hypothetical protein GCM10011356_15570 [Kangiella profundi]